ncbi:C39 family peptidase [Micromonospora sp. CPCC 206060]|uniref:C39 family peptidase n=1 Tax=Micromonospora sp. CPCC 206060 TaxID=3122406 RepID=UPI002FF2CA4E
MEDHVKDRFKQQLTRVASRRPYQVAAVSAVVLAVTSTTGLLLTRTDEPTRGDLAVAAVAERNDSTTGGVSRATRPSAATTPAPTASATTAPTGTPSAAAKPVRQAAVKATPTKPKPPAKKVLDVDYQAQTTYYYCGPAAVRNALTVRGIERSQDALAGPLNTDEFGTDSAYDTTRVLNSVTGTDFYRTRMIPGGAATSAQKDQLQADVVRAVSNGYAVVANVAGSVTDTEGGWHSFPGGHYIAVVGYADDGRSVQISDSADPATASYWLATTALANWIATRGYSA